MDKKSTLALTVVALAAGAALGILFAPDAGKATRGNIARKGRELKDKLNDMISEGTDLLGQLKSEAGTAASEARNAGKTAADQLSRAAREAASSAKS